MSVSLKFLNEEPSIPKEIRVSIATFMSYVHQSVNDMSKVYAQNDRRHNYTTPKSFLEMINLYRKVLSSKNGELVDMIQRLENGLEKLRVTEVQVDGLKKQLAVQEVELAKYDNILFNDIVLTSLLQEKRGGRSPDPGGWGRNREMYARESPSRD